LFSANRDGKITTYVLLLIQFFNHQSFYIFQYS